MTAEVLSWVLPSLLPALLALSVVYLSDRRREPLPLVALVFILGAAAKAGSAYAESRASTFTGLDIRVSTAGDASALLFLFGFVAPLREATKVAAVWPAFLSQHFDEPVDGVVYSSTAALGFACVENALTLREHPLAWVWVARTLVALPAHVFFAATWGYALGRARRMKRPSQIFPIAWIVATAAHGLYIHLVYGRGPGALLGTAPLVFGMAVLALFAVRDLVARGARSSRTSMLLERVSAVYVSGPPSLGRMRDALRADGHRIAFRWVAFGAVVTIGAMAAGVIAAVALGHWAHVDFSVVDEHDVKTTAPVALLGSGLLAAFPVSGYLVAKASRGHSLLEPALASALAIALTLALLGIAAPVALIFALAVSPVAWGLACMGAWVAATPGGRRGR